MNVKDIYCICCDYEIQKEEEIFTQCKDNYHEVIFFCSQSCYIKFWNKQNVLKKYSNINSKNENWLDTASHYYSLLEKLN